MQIWLFILVMLACLSFKIFLFTMHSKMSFSILIFVRILFVSDLVE